MDTYTKQVDCPEIQGHKPKGESAFNHRWHGIDTNTVSLSFENMIIEYNGDRTFPFDKRFIWLPRQEDWQNILFREYYAPAVPTDRKINAATIIMFQEHVDYMRGWSIYQPCEAWARLFMNVVHNKRWTDEGWV